MKFKLAILAAILAAALFGVPALADHSWNGYHWADRTPNVADGADSDLYDVDGAVTEWNGASPATIQMQYGGGKDIKVVSRNASPFYYGLAEIFIEDGHITRGKVTLNDRYLGDFTNNFPDVVLCQELGHILGLDHNRTQTNTCMNDTLDPNDLLPNGSDSPNSHDTQVLAEIYEHPDSLEGGNGNGGGGGPPCSKNPDHPNCREGFWVTVHVWKFDPANHPFPASQSHPSSQSFSASQSFPADGLPEPAVGPPDPFPAVVPWVPGPPDTKPPFDIPGPPPWLPEQAKAPEHLPQGRPF